MMNEKIKSIDNLYKAAERGENIYVSTLDPLLSEYVADISVNEALEMGEYLYTENCPDYTGKLIHNSLKFNNVTTDRKNPFHYRNYNYLLAIGCRSCGKSSNLNDFHDTVYSSYPFCGRGTDVGNKHLKCERCGEVIVPIFTKNDIDSLLDGKVSNKDTNDMIYVYGYRQGYVFEESGKRWWKNCLEHITSSKSLLEAKTANKSGKQTVKYHCESCGNDTHNYSTFQASSADEGMSIMYECTKCGNRTVINT